MIMNLTGLPTEVWFPTFTLVLGAAVQWFGDIFKENRSSKRERQARSDERAEITRIRDCEFQHDMLIKLQDSSVTLARLTAKAHFIDTLAARKSGTWGKQLLPDTLDEELRLSQVDLYRFKVRIADGEVRELATSLANISGKCAAAKTENESELILGTMSNTLGELQEKIGVVLRNLYSYKPPIK
jgi:hypothetical protein